MGYAENAHSSCVSRSQISQVIEPPAKLEIYSGTIFGETATEELERLNETEASEKLMACLPDEKSQM